MKSLVQCIMNDYNTSVIKMDLNASSNQKATTVAANNFGFLYDIEVLLSLVLFISRLNAVHCLI